MAPSRRRVTRAVTRRVTLSARSIGLVVAAGSAGHPPQRRPTSDFLAIPNATDDTIVRIEADDAACFGVVGRSHFESIGFGIPDRRAQESVSMTLTGGRESPLRL
jgi:hypothetical protein